MKKMLSLFIAGAVLTALLSGCGTAREEKPVLYSNLGAESVRMDLDALMAGAGITEQNRSVFFEHVDQFNGILKPEEMAQGFEPLGEPKYDPYELQDRWLEAWPDFLGYDCRITAFSLLEDDFLEIPQGAEIYDDSMILFDLAALEEDPSADVSRQGFSAFYSMVPGQKTENIGAPDRVWLGSWEERGIRIRDDSRARLISLVFHGEGEEENFLFVGHTGILFPTPDGDFWFLEKLSFQEPYQVVQVSSRKQLHDYLMGKYDPDRGQSEESPFLLENDRLMDIS